MVRAGVVSLCATLALLAAGGAQAAGLPPDCLVYGEARDLTALCERGGEILSRLDGQSDAAFLRRQFGERIHSPTLAGVDLTAPGHFWYLDPRKYSDPWVYAVRLADAEAFESGLTGWYAESSGAARPHHAPPPPLASARKLGYLFRVSDRVLLCADARAGVVVGQWLDREARRRRPTLQLRCAGQLAVRVDVRRLLTLYGREYDENVEAMKSRMREAIERLGQRPDAEAGIASAQAELGRLAALAREVEDVDAAFRLEADGATLLVNAQAATGTLLAQAVRAHPRGSTALLRRCPAEATLAFCSNFSAAEAAGNMALRLIGSQALETLKEAVTPEGGMMAALLLSPPPNRTARLIEVREGMTAATAWARWDRLTAREGAAAMPFALREEALPPKTPPETRLATAQLDERALGTAAARAVGRFFGATPRVAMRFASGRTTAAVGMDPLALLTEMDDLGLRPDQSLGADLSLRQTLAGLPPEPNVLLYASPTAVRDWLRLGGFKCGPAGTGERGFAVTLSLTEEGRVLGAVRLPTSALREAGR